jgi:ribosomal protein S15P/S13E
MKWFMLLLYSWSIRVLLLFFLMFSSTHSQLPICNSIPVIALTTRIQQMQTHMRTHKKDKSSKRGLDAMFVRRANFWVTWSARSLIPTDELSRHLVWYVS